MVTVRAVQPVRFIDGHNDTLLDLWSGGTGIGPFLDGRSDGHIDLRRARAGGLAAGVFAMFVPPELQTPEASPLTDRIPPYEVPLPEPLEPAYARRVADEMIALALELDARAEVQVVRAIDDLEHALADGPLGLILHFEGADPIDPGLEALDDFYERGLRSLGLVWSRANAFAEGVAFRFPSTPDTGAGLTAAGRRLVQRCNELGVVVDLAHLNERGFWDVAAGAEAPLVVSHANAHAIAPMSRNLTDSQLDEIGRSGGIVGITFHAGMVRADGRVDPATPLEELLRHLDHVVDRIGVDHVGFGSDFDGAVLLEEIGDVTGLRRLAEALSDRGYGEDEIAKLAHGNWLRVLAATWKP
jgi:membrane dipeptidase